MEVANELKIENSQLRGEIGKLEAIIKAYQEQLEKVIEYHSVEKYRDTVAKNRGML